MLTHKHHMIHGWIASHPKLDWICLECLKAWIPVDEAKGLWMMVDFEPQEESA